jgi:hypothetical protein
MLFTLWLFYAPVNLTIFYFTYYIDYKQNLLEQLSTNLKHNSYL